MAENEHHQRGFTDHLHLINQVAHHDAALGAFGSRMSAVEGTLAHVQDKVNSLDMKVSSGFASVESLIRENKAGQGPSLGELLKGVATGGAVIAMSAGAITMMVTSFVEPKLTMLAKTTEMLEQKEALRRASEVDEHTALKERRREYIDDTLKLLSGQAFKLRGLMPWETETRKAGGGE